MDNFWHFTGGSSVIPIQFIPNISEVIEAIKGFDTLAHMYFHYFSDILNTS
jgi:hypothetical protein